MKAILLFAIGLLAALLIWSAVVVFAAEAPSTMAPQPPTDNELKLQKALIDSQLLLMQYQFKELLDNQKKVNDELEKRHPTKTEAK